MTVMSGTEVPYAIELFFDYWVANIFLMHCVTFEELRKPFIISLLYGKSILA